MPIETNRSHARSAVVDPLHVVGHLAEPDDVGPDPAGDRAGRATRALAHRPVPGEALVAGEAPAAGQLAVHVEQALGPGALVQVVDILRDDQQLARPFGIEPRQRVMRGVGLDLAEPRPPRVVELVDQRRIAAIGLGRRDVLDAMPLPQAVRRRGRSPGRFRR